MKRPFLGKNAIETLWTEQLRKLCPPASLPSEICKGDLKADLGLDSLDIFELAGHFHSVFHLIDPSTQYYLLQYRRAEEWIDCIWQAANEWDRPISFFTSGSTGVPEICPHHKTNLIEEISCWVDILHVQGDIWSFVSPQHIYGFLFSILLAEHHDLHCIDARETGLPGLLSNAKKGDWVIGFPDLYRQWERQEIPHELHLISSSAPLKKELATHWTDQGCTIYSIYGCSEVGGIGYRRAPQSFFQLLPYWTHKGGHLIRSGENGAHLFSPKDHLFWQAADRFVLGERKDQAVQVGGINVFPKQIAERMAALPSVQACWVRKMHPSEGVRLKCWVIPNPNVPEADWPVLRQELFQWIENELSPPERPRSLTLSSKVPKNDLGKETDWITSIASGLYS
ncbi:MAG: AMP-binding protein [Bacteroidota bacterium]